MKRSRSALQGAASRCGRVALLVGLLLGVLAAPALAGEKVRLHVQVTHVSSAGSGIDPKAFRLDKSLKKQFVYDSIKVIKDRRMDLELDSVGKFKLPNGKAVRMRPIHRGDDSVLMAVDVEGAARLDARVKSHKPLVIRAGPYKGGHLVVSIELDD